MSTPPASWILSASTQVTSYVVAALCNADSPTYIAGLENKTDPFGFIVSVAMRYFLGAGYKPTLENYHITWDPPKEMRITNNTTYGTQWIDRSCKGRCASREMLQYWESAVRTALIWYAPHKKRDSREEEQGDEAAKPVLL